VKSPLTIRVLTLLIPYSYETNDIRQIIRELVLGGLSAVPVMRDAEPVQLRRAARVARLEQHGEQSDEQGVTARPPLCAGPVRVVERRPDRPVPHARMAAPRAGRLPLPPQEQQTPLVPQAPYTPQLGSQVSFFIFPTP